MALAPCTDLSPAAWIVRSGLPWDRLVSFGPPGLPAYARLRFIPDPGHPGQAETDVDLPVDTPSEWALLRAALDTLARFTGTPERCYVGVWDGWSPGPDRDHDAERRPALLRPVPDAPKVVVPHRSYHLFRGPLRELADPGSAAQPPGVSGPDPPVPAFVWPADRAWCVTKDVDRHWAGIGADASAIDRLVADARLDVVPTDPDDEPPAYR